MSKQNQEGIFAAMLAGLLTTLLLVANPAQALTPVDPTGGCGQTLSAPGEYILTGDLNCSGTNGNGIDITASNVVFHLAGRTITSTDCDLTKNISGIFIQGGLSNVQIDGGTVSGFNDGIVLSSANSRLVGMTVTNACAFGIAVSGQNNRLERNIVTTSRIDGIALGQASGNLITANDISGNARAGVDISDFADSNVIENNILNNNGSSGEGYGVAVFNGHGNVIRHNTANNNDFGIRIGSAVKRDGTAGLSNTVTGNTVSGNAKLGIWLEKVIGAPSVVKRNTVLGNGDGDADEADMWDDNASCDGNLWKNNTFQTDRVAGGPDATNCIN